MVFSLLNATVFGLAAPPSLPLCLWDGYTGVGGTVTLSCMVAEGVPTPEMRWHKLQPEEISLPMNMDGKSCLTCVLNQSRKKHLVA